MQQDPDTLIEYDRVIKDQLDKGIIEPVCDLEEEGKLFYLPHNPVIRRDAKTTKLRVVYDASAKDAGKGVSLNDCLHVGPALTSHLYDVLIGFREKRIAILGDFEKAFLNVAIAMKYRDSLRCMWVDDVNAKEIKPVEYRFCRVVFGVNCSPFLLNATVEYHLDTFAKEDPQFAESMKRSLYVDDWVGGHDNYEGALKIFDTARSTMAKGGFRLRKWLTNDPNLRPVMRKVASEETASENVEDDQSYAKATLGNTQDTGIEKVLGMKWDCTSDEFIFSFERIVERAEMLEPTKGNIPSILASLYVPYVCLWW